MDRLIGQWNGWHNDGLADRLINRKVNWLVDGTMDWLDDGWSVDRTVDWLVGRRVGSVSWSMDQLTDSFSLVSRGIDGSVIRWHRSVVFVFVFWVGLFFLVWLAHVCVVWHYPLVHGSWSQGRLVFWFDSGIKIMRIFLLCFSVCVISHCPVLHGFWSRIRFWCCSDPG